MYSCRQAIQYELQAKRICITANFTLAQFQLMQNRFELFMRHTIVSYIIQHIQYQRNNFV